MIVVNTKIVSLRHRVNYLRTRKISEKLTLVAEQHTSKQKLRSDLLRSVHVFGEDFE